MCGIAGLAAPDAAMQRPLLERMSERIAHRGPDDAGLWFSDGVALAHRRLSIIDLSPEGHQPMLSLCGRYAITFNGEIYNYVELRRELETLGDRFRGASDTEVLLAAYRRWGEAMLPRLNGMWAFAIWDVETRTLFASRDRFGKKPFYYATAGERFLFASEIKTLFACPNLAREPDLQSIADFASERVSDHGDASFFAGVFQLPAGCVLRWRAGKLEIRSYWRLEARARGDYARPDIEELRGLLRSAVDLRLRADTPVGALLSGGLDSSLVTCLAAEGAAPGGQPISTFSTIHDPPYEEAQGIAAVQQAHPSLRSFYDSPTARDFWDEVEQVLWHQEQPFADASMVAHFRLMRLARRSGVPVILSGQAADEVFAGYPGYLWIYLGSRLRQGSLGRFAQTWAQISAYQSPPLRNVILNMLPRALSHAAKAAASRAGLDWLATDRRPSQAIFHDRPGGSADPLDEALLQSIEVRTLPGFLHYEDRNAMAFGVETRLPFLDYRLVEALFRLSPDDKLAGGVTKSLLRRMAEGVAPDSIRLQTRKTGYPAPLSHYLRQQPERIREAAAAPCPLIEPKAWSRHVDRFFAGDDRRLDAVWRGYMLCRWYDRFIEKGAG